MKLLFDQNLSHRLVQQLADLSFIYGHPPKVVRLRRADCATSQAAKLLRDRHAVIQAAEHDDSVSVVVLF